MAPFFLLFLKGILIGLVISAPVGPVGILCIRRTLGGRYGLSLITGFGAALADTFYGAIAGFSLAEIANFISSYNFYLRLIGGLLVLWIGGSIFRTSPTIDPHEKASETILHAFTSSFFITLSNPLVLLVFAATFTALGIAPAEDSLTHGLSLVSGVFVGASSWWFGLSTLMFFHKHRLSSEHLLWINRLSGIMLLGFGIYILLSLV